MTKQILGLVAVGLFAGPALALTTYTDEGAFLADAGATSTETFDSGPSGLAPGTFDFGQVSVDLQGTPFNPSFFGVIDASRGGSGRVVAFYGQDTTATFTFDSPITAFGLSIFDLGTQVPTDLGFIVDGVPVSLFSGFTGPIGNQLFGGVIDLAGFTTVSVINSAYGDYVELDNLHFQSAGRVPEPGSLALLALGLVGLGLGRRRKA